MKIIAKDEILKRLNSKNDFIKEYDINIETIYGTTKKAEFIHKNCPNNGFKDFRFTMIVKDFLKGQRCPCCAAHNRILHNMKRREHVKKRKGKKVIKRTLNDIIEIINKSR